MPTLVSWIFLTIAIAGDVVGTAALERASRGHYRRYLALAVASYLTAFYAFARALQVIPTSIADAIYAAVGTAFVTAFSVLWLKERLTRRKLLALILVTAGVVVLQLEASHG